ncbi:predicted protein [Sclerotinia sclerotiorum 1980 UF-70]|uniref:Uncharacterized protein n=1 Tax=Sclerotinia sclerotiorum (strain ATCC 18683 / 1980 / Ss-1) TaxID=665079 RepID=A7F6M4_SCLS1|nr:predicted protein [Sclerotinia sclerotiorum 1980 UF-70]EDN98395.1 predicted protein [Sclerotinia sclerotiorum 1980 UF-70]
MPQKSRRQDRSYCIYRNPTHPKLTTKELKSEFQSPSQIQMENRCAGYCSSEKCSVTTIMEMSPPIKKAAVLLH